MLGNLKLNTDLTQPEIRVGDRAAMEQALARARRLRAEAIRAWAAMLSGWLRTRVVEPLRRARQRRADLEVLMRLDDRTLSDIGLHRSDIAALVYGGTPLRRSSRVRSAQPTPEKALVAEPAPAKAAEGEGLAKAA